MVKNTSIEIEDILTRLLAALREQYRDICTPGVIVSHVGPGREGKGEYYAAIHRYPHGPNSREVLQKAYSSTPGDAIWHVANNWLQSMKPPDTELKALNDLLKK